MHSIIRRPWLAWPLAVAVLLTGAVAAPASAAVDDQPWVDSDPPVGVETVPGRIVVRWADDASPAARQQLRDEQGLWTLDAVEPLSMELVGVRHDAVQGATAALNAHPAVRFAEPELVIEVASDDPPVNDRDYGKLWGLESSSDIDIDAREAWEVTRGSSEVIVAVIDTGVQIDHPDLVGNIWVNEDEIPGNGVDDDGNGYVDDVNGWDFKHGNASVYDDPGEDDHGTHVAGTIAAVADNEEGIAGVAPNVKIMPLKFLGGSTGTGSSYDASLAVAYAAANGARIVNASWGGGGGTSLKTAIRDATGVAFVAAAGNNGRDVDVDPYYPGSWARDSHGMGTVLSVASITRHGVLSYFSNYGVASVDVAAPGSSIYSTLPSSTYGTYSGTSMAAPHASGVAALVASLRPDLDGASLVEAVKAGVEPLAAADGATTTGGLLNAHAAVAPYHVPGAPTGVTAVAGNGQAAVSWTAPTTGGAPTSYTVAASPAEEVEGDASRVVDAPATSLVFDGLTNGTAYTFTVTATNAGGSGAASDPTDAVTPAPTVPGEPTGLTATIGDGIVDLAWSAPEDDGGATVESYSVTVSPADDVTGDTTRTVADPESSLTFDGLSNGTAYTFAVAATNSEGTGAAVTSDEVTPRVLTVPGAPTDLTVSADHESATVGWDAPEDDGGRTISGYVVTATTVPDEVEETGTVVATVETTDTSAVVTDLTAGTTYTFAVEATNTIGTGDAIESAPTTLPALTPPGAPTGVTATPGDGRATVTWDSPADDGGRPATSYTVTASPGGATAATDSTSATVTGLSNGTAYTFAVTATNAIGTGPASAPSAAVTPVAPPAPAPPPSGGGGGGGGGGAPAPAPSPTAPGQASGTVEPGGTITTDPAGTGATTDAPAQTAVTSPVAGDVTVEMTDVRAAAPARWSFLTVEVTIAAPAATAGEPLALEFRLDGSLDADGVVPFRNGVPVPDCPGADIADPDPCLAGRTTAGDDVVLTVLTSRASTWNFGHPAVACPDGRVVAASFTDVSGVHAASVECLAWWQVTSGRTATIYGAADAVRRDQMASFVARSLTEAGIALPAAGNRFRDVDGGAHGTAVEALAAAGIVGGVGDGRYGPAGQVTRAQMASFLAATVEYATGAPLPAASGAFGDLGASVHAGAVEAVHAAGLVRGVAPGSFAPGRPVTRAQMASFLVNLLDLFVERGITRPPVR